MRVVTGGELSEPMLDRLDEDDLRRCPWAGRVGSCSSRGPGRSATTSSRVSRSSPGGFRSLVAHPERHTSPDFRERLEALVAAGALIQVTAEKIAEGRARR